MCIRDRAKADRNQPVLAAPMRKSLAVSFKGSVQSYLGQIVTVGIRHLNTRDLRGKAGPSRFRPAIDCVLLITPQFKLCDWQWSQRSGENMNRVQGQSDCVV